MSRSPSCAPLPDYLPATKRVRIAINIAKLPELLRRIKQRPQPLAAGAKSLEVLFDKHLPAEYQAKFGWRQLAALLRRAARGREDAAQVAAALQLVLQIERVPYRVV